MFKLVSDPTQLPIREVNFTRDARMEVVPVQPGGISRDKIFTAARDGSRLGLLRPSGYDFRLNCDYLDYEQFKALQKAKELRVPMYLFPNFDKETRLWAPMTGTLKGLKYDPQLRHLESFDISHSRSHPAYYTDESGILQRANTGTPRFMESSIGKGFFSNDNLANLAITPNPTSGSLGWYTSSVGATGSLAWSTREEWPLYSAEGSVKVNVGKSEGGYKVSFLIDTNSTSSDGSERYVYGFWYRGTGRADVRGHIGSQVELATTFLMGRFDDGWQFAWFTIDKTDPDTFLRVELSFRPQVFEQEWYFGGMHGGLQGFSGDVHQPMWTDETSSSDPDLFMASPVNLQCEQFTYTVAGLISPGTSGRLGYNASGSTSFQIGFTSTGVLQAYVGGIYFSADTSSEWVEANDGVPFVAGVRCNLTDLLTSTGTKGVTLFFRRRGGQLLTDRTSDPACNAVFIDTFRLTGGRDNNSDYILPQHIRWDARAWSDAEIDLHSKMMTDDSFRDIHILTQGRQYIIGDINMAHRRGGWDQMVGSVDLLEISRDPDWAIVA